MKAPRRVWWISLAGVMLVPQSCVPKAAATGVVINHVQVDSAFADFLAELRDVLPTERVLCVYGYVSNDSVWVNFVKPAKMKTRTRTRAEYDSCPRPKTPTPIAQYLGVWHQHNVPEWNYSDLCTFSEEDSRSFTFDVHAIVDLLSCGGNKLMARSKYK